MNRTFSKYKASIDYVIGIDFGHGETSAAICPMQWDRPAQQLDPVKDLELGGNKKVIPSAITILENGDAYIGDSAFSPYILKNAEVKIGFKIKPENINGKDEKTMIRFMAEVYKKIRENNTAILTDTNYLVYIATPSGWNRPAQDLYAIMAKRAGIPLAGVIKESRAALVRAQHDQTSGLGRSIEKGAIVFDMGSSTLDFTYMNKDLPNLIDNGYDCGASYIERTIFKKQEETNKAIKLFESKYAKLVDYLIFEIRKIKEQVYFDQTLKVKKTINFDDFIEDDDLEDERLKLSFNPGDLNQLLNDCGYIKSIEDAMNDYKLKYINNQKIFGVFLTGGASRMDFIKPLVCKCWGVDDSQVYRDNDPSLTISQGVAEVARMDLRTIEMNAELDTEINQIESSDGIYNNFVNNYEEHLYEVVSKCIKDCLILFQASEKGVTITACANKITWTPQELQLFISNKVQEAISNDSEAATQYLHNSIALSIEPIRKKAEDIIMHYSYQGNNVNLSDFDLSAIRTSNLNIECIMKEISPYIAKSGTNWGVIIAGTITSTVLGFLSPILFPIPIFLSSVLKSPAYKSITKNWDKIQNCIKQSVHEALTSNNTIKTSINKASKEVLDKYKDNIKSVRLLID